MSDPQKHKLSKASRQRQTPRQAGRVVQAPITRLEEPDRLPLQRALDDPAMASPAGIVALQRHCGNTAMTKQLQLSIAQSSTEVERSRSIIQRRTLNAAADMVNTGSLVCYQFVAATLLATEDSKTAKDVLGSVVKLHKPVVHTMFETRGKNVDSADTLNSAADGSIIGMKRLLGSWSDHVMIRIQGNWVGVNNPGGIPGKTEYPNLGGMIYGESGGGDWKIGKGTVGVRIIEGQESAKSAIESLL